MMVMVTVPDERMTLARVSGAPSPLETLRSVIAQIVFCKTAIDIIYQMVDITREIKCKNDSSKQTN